MNYIPVRYDMMRQTNDCSPVRVMQHKVKLQVDPALGPAALGLGRSGALPAGLVQPCPKPRALIHKHGTLKWPYLDPIDYTSIPHMFCLELIYKY